MNYDELIKLIEKQYGMTWDQIMFDVNKYFEDKKRLQDSLNYLNACIEKNEIL